MARSSSGMPDKTTGVPHPTGSPSPRYSFLSCSPSSTDRLYKPAIASNSSAKVNQGARPPSARKPFCFSEFQIFDPAGTLETMNPRKFPVASIARTALC
jgi:hypothetical protein